MCPFAALFVLLVSYTTLVFAKPLFQSTRRATTGRIYDLGQSAGVAGQNASFDYVVVGGGTAGLTIAATLAQDPSVTVAVIEAGGFYEVDAGNLSVIPAQCSYFTGTSPEDINPEIDWGFVTEPQAGANNRRMHYAQGKTLGGSSARNYLVYHRPTIDSLNDWATQVGDSSYTFENLLPYYKQGIHYTPPNKEVLVNITATPDSPLAFGDRNGNGPLQVSYDNIQDGFNSWAQFALRDSGLTNRAGFNMGELIGSGFMALTIDQATAHRSSSESSFLQVALQNTTLKVYKQTLAEKILFSGNNSAMGVVVSTNGSQPYILNAKKEVILSAGAFRSPQLLMVSGIGPRATLEQLNIPVLKDLPGVGQNLQDQPWWGSSFRVDVETASTLQNNPQALAAAEEAYRQSATGPLAASAGGVFAWEKFPPAYRQNFSAATQQALAAFPEDWPELEWLPLSAFSGTSQNPQTADPMDGHNYATLATALIAPLSRGNVSIRSSSMAAPPLINPNWLTDPVDVELAIAAFKRQRQLWSVIAGFGVTVGDEAFSGPAVQTDAEIISAIRGMVAPLWHASATCKMGLRNDTMAVIDAEARVYGTSGLRVVDASSFPFLPPGHPQGTIYALAQKIASRILDGR